MSRRGESNLAWRANSNVLPSRQLMREWIYTKAVSKKDIQEGIAQLLPPGHLKTLSKVYRKQCCETPNGENWPDSNLLISGNQVDGPRLWSINVSAALNDPLWIKWHNLVNLQSCSTIKQGEACGGYPIDGNQPMQATCLPKEQFRIGNIRKKLRSNINLYQKEVDRVDV